MKLEELKQLNIKKGRIHTIHYMRDVDISQKYVDMGYYSLVIVSRMQGMFGRYSNRKSVIEKKANGQPSKPSGLYAIIEGILYEGKEEPVLRLLPIASKARSKVYILNGEVTTLEELRKTELPKSYYESRSGDRPDCITLKLSGVTAIN